MLLFFYFGMTLPIFAQNLSSSSYEIENPTIILEGGEAVSPSFKYFSSTGQAAIGESTSLSFINRQGFLYFPAATSALLSATAGDGEVDLSWSASLATHANVTHYSVGVSTSIGGIYTYTPVGNVLSHTVTGLSNGTTYYFKVRTYADGIVLAVSNIVSTTPVGATPPNGGGGGSGSSSIPPGPDDEEIFPYVPGHYCKIADFNCDDLVNILDLSILLYYQNKSGSAIGFYDLNKDGKVGFADASIMFYYWDL